MKYQFSIFLLVLCAGLFPAHHIFAAEQPLHVPILMYHNILRLPHHNPYVVAPKMFEEQMAWLASNGYTSISMDDFLRALDGTKQLPPKSVLITFDDGHKNQFENAFPVLKKYQMKALFYVVPGFAGRPRSMSLDMIAELHVSGMEIGSHTMTHALLAHSSERRIITELSESKKILEKKLRTPIKHFAYPGGDFSSSTEKFVRAAGYTDAVSTRHNAFHTRTENKLAIPRLHVDNDMKSFVRLMQATR